MRGFVTLVGVAVLLTIGVLVAIPNRRTGHRPRNDSRAIGTLRALITAQEEFRARRAAAGLLPRYGCLEELVAEELVDPTLGNGTRCGYTFQTSPSITTPEHLWFACANPVIPGMTGDRFFATNQAGVVFHVTSSSIALDTSACDVSSFIPTGK